MKRKIITVLISFGISISLLVLYVTYLFMSSSTISRGQPIAEYDQPTSALLVIDIQEGTTGEKSITEGYVQQSESFIQKVNAAIDWADSSSIQVVYIYHETTNWLLNIAMQNVLARGSHGAEIDQRIKIVSDNLFSKHKMDAFSNPALDAFLLKNKVNKIYAVGLDAAYCVNKTVFAAQNRGFHVTVIEDAIISEKETKKIEMIDKFKSAGIEIIQSSDLFLPKPEQDQL